MSRPYRGRRSPVGLLVHSYEPSPLVLRPTLEASVSVPRRRLLVDIGPLRRSRGFRILIAGQGVSTLGSQLTAVAVPYQVFRLTHSSLAVGLVSLTQLVPLLVCSLIGGAVADAHDRRKVLHGYRVRCLP